MTVKELVEYLQTKFPQDIEIILDKDETTDEAIKWMFYYYPKDEVVILNN